MQEDNGDMDVEESTSQLDQESLHSLTPVLDENTSFTKHQFSQIVRDADWKELSESSFKLHSKENSAVLADGSDCSTEDVILSASLKTSFCASPDKKGNVLRKSVLRNRNTRSENVELQSGNFQELLQQSTDTDESCIESRKSVKSGFRRKISAATNNKRTSKFASAEFRSAFNSSTESVDRSKLSVTVNSEDSVILALKEKKSSCFTRKKSSDIKKSFPIDFRNAFNSSADDSQINFPKKKRLNCDISLNESVVKKRNSGFLKNRGKNYTGKVDFQNIFDSSEESTHKSQREDNSANENKNISVTENENFNCNQDNIEPNVSNKSSSEQTHNEQEENLLNKKTESIIEVLRNSHLPETDEVEISQNISKKVNVEVEESLLKNLKSFRQGSAEDSLVKDKSSQLSGTQSKNTNKTSSGIGIHSVKQPENVTELLRNSHPPETDEVEISQTLSKEVNAEKEESLVLQLNSKSSGEGNPEGSLGKDKSFQLSKTLSEDTSKVSGEVRDAIERSFTGTGTHSAKQSENIIDLLRNSHPPETDEVEISQTLSSKVNVEKEESLVDQLKNLKSSREGSAEDSLVKDKSGTQSENTSKTHGEVLDAIERSFTSTGLHSINQPYLVVPKECDVSSRVYISNMSVQENSLIPSISNDSSIKPGEIGKPDSLPSLVLQLDYDSMDSGSETDDSRTPPSNNHVNALKSKIQSDETSFRKGTEKDMSDNISLRRSSRNLSKTDSNTNKKSKSNSTKKNVHEKSATKSRTLTKADDITTNMVVESNSFDGSEKGIGSKAASVHQSTVLVSNASDYFNSLETTNDDSVAGPNNFSLQNSTNKEESVFKVPTADISSRVLSLRRKNSWGSQNKSTEKSYQLKKNASAGDKSVCRDNDSNDSIISSKTKRTKSQRHTPQSNNENSSENLMLNNSSIDSRLRRGFSELKKCNKVNKDGDQLLIEKVFSFGSNKLQKVNRNDMDVEENCVNKNIRLKKPKRWVSDHLYNFLIKKLEPKYDFKARFRSEKFVEFLCEKYDIVVKEKVDFKRHVDELILEMAKLHIIVNVFDFYDFVLKFLPYVFSEKSVPYTRPFGLPNIVVPPPAGTLFDNIL